MGALVDVEVIYAASGEVYSEHLSIPAGTSVRGAIEASKLLKTYPEIDLTQGGVGIFGRRVALHEVVSHNDRVEIYRPLIVDPKTARQRRAALRARRNPPNV